MPINGFKNVHILKGVLFSQEEEWKYVICWKMDGDHGVKQPDSERSISHVFFNMWNLEAKKRTYESQSWIIRGNGRG